MFIRPKKKMGVVSPQALNFYVGPVCKLKKLKKNSHYEIEKN